MGTANDQFISMGGGPNELVMKTKCGKTLTIVDAIGSVSVKVPNGGMIASVSISDQVTVVYQNKTMRLKAPDLKKWIGSDMNKLIEDTLKDR
ncbi:hypothetical protein [Paenibacillus alba]|uniref:hypothetical protein n=1 Tax=Paenibacillus alba TaxID=1197127 RepID=UPI001564BA76|nr:hypothetical protein [Paenibacillus alba]